MKKIVDLTTNNFLNAMNSLLNKYAPFKKLVNINSNLQQNLGLLMVNKTQYLFKKKNY